MSDLKRYSKVEIVEILNLIKTELFKQYERKGVFTDQELDSTGLIYDCAGLTSILLLKNGLEDDIKYSETEISIIKKVYKAILNYLKVNGYDASPFLPAEKTKDLFSIGKGFSYTDSVSWVLSVFVQLWNANKLEKGALIEEECLGDIKKVIKDTLVLIDESATEIGGWGFTKGCTSPDIYYSYTISESLADFADYILGESLAEGIGSKDQELIDYLTKGLIDSIDKRREQTAKWLVDTFIINSEYKIGDILINPFDLSGKKFLGLLEPKYNLKEDEKFTLLYYTFFVIDMLIINNADERFVDSAQLIKQSIEHGIYLSRMYFDKARKTRDIPEGGWWNDKEDSSLRIDFANHSTILNPRNKSVGKIKEPGLVPLALRCNVLYSFYISKGPDNKIDELLNIVFEERNAEKQDYMLLWDKSNYNLMVTERAIEALIDYYDFVKKFSSSNETGIPESAPFLRPELPQNVDSILKLYIENEVKSQLSNNKLSSNSNYSLSIEKLNTSIETGIKDYFSKNSVFSITEESTQDEKSKNTLLFALTSVFADLSDFIKGEGEIYKNGSSSKRYKANLANFTLKYLESLKCLLFYKLKEKEPDRKDEILKNLNNQDLLFQRIASQLGKKENPINFGHLFNVIFQKSIQK